MFLKKHGSEKGVNGYVFGTVERFALVEGSNPDGKRSKMTQSGDADQIIVHRQVIKKSSAKTIARRSRLKAFIKVVNYNHIMPTR